MKAIGSKRADSRMAAVDVNLWGKPCRAFFNSVVTVAKVIELAGVGIVDIDCIRSGIADDGQIFCDGI